MFCLTKKGLKSERAILTQTIGVLLHFRVTVLWLFSLTLAAAILVWFGSGWSRLGLTVVAYWVCFL
jgi:hypothetical protein